jgi:hypothetical protein
LRRPQITSTLPPIPPHEGAFRDRHERGGGQRWTREIAAFCFECGRTIASRTAKPCGPGAPTLALSMRRRLHVS